MAVVEVTAWVDSWRFDCPVCGGREELDARDPFLVNGHIDCWRRSTRLLREARQSGHPDLWAYMLSFAYPTHLITAAVSRAPRTR